MLATIAVLCESSLAFNAKLDPGKNFVSRLSTMFSIPSSSNSTECVFAVAVTAFSAISTTRGSASDSLCTKVGSRFDGISERL